MNSFPANLKTEEFCPADAYYRRAEIILNKQEKIVQKEDAVFFRASNASFNKLKYLYKVTQYFVTPKGENLFDDTQYTPF